MSAIGDVAAERKRQVAVEGWTASLDDEHRNGELALAAACYACCDQFPGYALNMWPYDAEWWKPKTERRNLVMAAALLVAEIERIDRATARDQPAAGAPSKIHGKIAKLASVRCLLSFPEGIDPQVVLEKLQQEIAKTATPPIILISATGGDAGAAAPPSPALAEAIAALEKMQAIGAPFDAKGTAAMRMQELARIALASLKREGGA